MKYLPILLTTIILACNGEQEDQQSVQRGGPMAVDVFVLQPKPINNIFETPGNLLANEEVQVRAELAGRIESIPFKEGSYVKKGEVLIHIDDVEFRAQKAKLQAQLNNAKSDLKRKEELAKINGVSQEELENAQSNVLAIQADLDLTQSKIDKSTIRAPFNGRVGLRQASVGAFVSNGDVIASLVQADPIKIEFSVPERYAALLKEGLQVQFEVAGIDSVFTSSVYAVEPAVSATSRSLTGRALINNPKGLLIPGSYANVKITLENINDALLLPTTAIITQLKGQKVLVKRNGTAISVPVKVGIRTEDSVQITGGLQPGDTVITSALLSLKDGAPVQAKASK